MTDHQRELLEYTCRVCGLHGPERLIDQSGADVFVAYSQGAGRAIGIYRIYPFDGSDASEQFWMHELRAVCTRERREVRFAFNADGEPITLVALPPEPDFLGNPHMGFAQNPEHTAESLALCMSQAWIGAEN